MTVAGSRWWTLAAAVVVACALFAFAAEQASAWPGDDKDRCAGASPGDQVTTRDPVVHTNPRGERGAWTIRACSPTLKLGGLATASPTEMYKQEVLPGNVMQGGDRAPFISRDRLKTFPFLMGPEGQAVRYGQLRGTDILIGAIGGAVGSVGPAIVVGVISCIAGGWATGGIACLAIPSAAVAGIAGIIGGVIAAVIQNQLDRVITMSSSAWDYHVPEGWKHWISWNGFGTIGHNFIDPSFTNKWPGETPPFRMWAWFSAYPVEQGRNPDAQKSAERAPAPGVPRGLPPGVRPGPPIGAGDLDPHRLRTRDGEITRNGPDQIIETSSIRDLLRTQRGDDVIFAKDVRDAVFGGSGEDVLVGKRRDELHGGRDADSLVALKARDRLNGGRGEDTLVAWGRRDRLNGGRGTDSLVSERGGATLNDPHGSNAINVMNGHRTDTVICAPGSRDIAIVDRGDRVSRNCRYVFVDGKGAPRSPTLVGKRGFNGSLRGTRRVGR